MFQVRFISSLTLVEGRVRQPSRTTSYPATDSHVKFAIIIILSLGRNTSSLLTEFSLAHMITNGRLLLQGRSGAPIGLIVGHKILRRQIGCICGHAIYAIDESLLITMPHGSVQTDLAHSKNEQRYKKLLSSIDLTKDFFYSYAYPVMQSLQKNVLSKSEVEMAYDNIFVWNAYLTEVIRSSCKYNIWTVSLVHGHFRQVCQFLTF
ncbi:hypothetical protein Droror1_Dr00008509 [Drosera rotundifolia]